MKNIMSYELNEDLHIPDKENVDLLVDDIVKEIYRGTSSVLYLHMPFTGNTEPGNVSVTVELRNVNKYCKWIGDNNRVICDIWFNQDRSGVVSNFDEQAKGLGIIREADPVLNIPPCIDYSYIRIVISVAKGEYNYNLLYDKIKTCLRHEFAHMYKEIVSPTIFELSDKSENTKDFMIGYDNIVEALKHIKFDKKEEFKFLSMLYKCSYVERDANISSFYQALLNDASKIENIKDISSYKEYYEYEDYKSIFDTDILNLFEKYKNDIQYMYGKNINNVDRFSTIIKKHIDTVLNKMSKVYYGIKNIIKTSNITESLNYDQIKNDYKERFRKMIFPESKFDDINEHLVSESWLKDYMKTQNNGNIRILELIFDNDGN